MPLNRLPDPAVMAPREMMHSDTETSTCKAKIIPGIDHEIRANCRRWIRAWGRDKPATDEIEFLARSLWIAAQCRQARDRVARGLFVMDHNVCQVPIDRLDLARDLPGQNGFIND
jgi:hypothetical protein